VRAGTGPFAPPKAKAASQEAAGAAPPSTGFVKQSRRTPEQQTRLFMNVGAEMGIVTGDVVGAILGETGLPGKVVGTVDVRERHLFVDVASEHANAIISKLNRTQIKGHRLKVKVA
jgi:ATP-dependent RNA helicase DeaD